MRSRKDPEEESRAILAERYTSEAQKAGFDLSFDFVSQPEGETLVRELRDIATTTFWANNPFEGKVSVEEMAPDVRARYEALMARKEEIISQKEELFKYLAPYIEAAKVWISKKTSQTVLDEALNIWTRKRDDHRQRFLAAVALVSKLSQ